MKSSHTSPHRHHNCPLRFRGFTLIELMVVVAIVGILSAIGYPSYVKHITKGRRSDVQGVMLQAAQYLQRYYAAQNTFDNAKLPNTYVVAPIGASDATSTGYNYKLTLTIGTDKRSYSIKATPNSAVFTDGECGYFTLDDTGKKGTESGSVAACWR